MARRKTFAPERQKPITKVLPLQKEVVNGQTRYYVENKNPYIVLSGIRPQGTRDYVYGAGYYFHIYRDDFLTEYRQHNCLVASMWQRPMLFSGADIDVNAMVKGKVYFKAIYASYIFTELVINEFPTVG